MPQPMTYTAAKSGYAIFGVLLGIPAALGIAVSIKSGDWLPMVFFSLPLLLTITWLSRFRLAIGDTYVAYRSWMHRGQFNVADVAEISFAGVPLSDRNIPSSICVLRLRDGKAMSINLKVFPRDGALRLVNHVRASCSSAIGS